MQKDRLTAYAWFDKKAITFLSTCVDPTEAATVKRRCRDGTQKDVDCPAVVTKYNISMGGVDRADQIRTAYPSSRKSRKWWKYIFWFLVNAMICMGESPNHVIKTRSGKTIKRTQLGFRENFARQLVSNYRGSPEEAFPVQPERGWRGTLARQVREDEALPALLQARSPTRVPLRVRTMQSVFVHYMFQGLPQEVDGR